jgi:FAD-linked sulfhydryl oxidase
MGIAPDVWGPAAWQTIHLFCLAAPETLSATEQLYYISFFQALSHVLPCSSCAEHFQEHLKTYPIESSVATRDSLFEWSVHVHNAANQMLGKPILTVEAARAHWDKVISKGGNGSSAGAGGMGMGGNATTSGIFMKLWITVLLIGIAVFAGVFGARALVRVSKKK